MREILTTEATFIVGGHSPPPDDPLTIHQAEIEKLLNARDPLPNLSPYWGRDRLTEYLRGDSVSVA